MRLPMLQSGARYRVSQVLPEGADPKDGTHSSSAFFETLRGAGALLDGAWLAEDGLPLPRALAETAFIVRLTRV